MARRRIDSPNEHKGAKTVVRLSVGCGWCLSNDCEHCKPEITYYEKIYLCGCKCAVDYWPEGIPKEETKENKDEVRTMRVSDEAGQHAESIDAPGNMSADRPEQDEDSVEEPRTDGDLQEQEE
jgi:hypothetical protein